MRHTLELQDTAIWRSKHASHTSVTKFDTHVHANRSVTIILKFIWSLKICKSSLEVDYMGSAGDIWHGLWSSDG